MEHTYTWIEAHGSGRKTRFAFQKRIEKIEQGVCGTRGKTRAVSQGRDARSEAFPMFGYSALIFAWPTNR